jgi:hypothetical protein
LSEVKDTEYECTKVSLEVEEAEKKRSMDGLAYVFKSKEELYGTWSWEEFESKHHSEFLHMCKGFAKGLHARIPF